MQKISKKKRRSLPALRWLLLALLAGALCGTILALKWVNRPVDVSGIPGPDTYGELLVYDASQVAYLTCAQPDGSGWTLVQRSGTVTLQDAPGFALDTQVTQMLLQSASVVSYSDVLTEEKADYADHPEEFGLDAPCVVDITYEDGRTVTLRIGSRSDDIDDAFYYMTIDGDDRLFALDVTTAVNLTMERALLHAVVQPVIHKARIDSIMMEMPDGTLAWTLDGSIENADAADRWLLTSPSRYPADGERMDKLRENLSNIRVGAYVAEATPETLTQYGFDAPRLILTVHMAEGTLGSISEEGVYTPQAWPESTVTITVGGAKSDSVDYVLLDGSIYISSHFSLQVFMDMKAQSTLTRYPVLTSLSNLRSLTIEQDGRTQTYRIYKPEIPDDDDIAPDDEALLPTAERDGKPISYEAFEAAYDHMLIATVSGALPDGWQQTEDAHTLYTFQTQTGITHTIALTPFDALHDAVVVDGCAMFYMIRGGLAFTLE